MTQLRTARKKGAMMEYDTQASLLPVFPDIYLTKQRGFQLQWDLQSDEYKVIIECKRWKSLPWNKMQKLFDKLEAVCPDDYEPFLVFQTNQQPCLVYDGIRLILFQRSFAVPFIRHTPVKRGNKND